MNRRRSSVAGALLLAPLLGGCSLGAERYLVACVDVATDVCRRSEEKAADDFRRTSEERIESITVNGDGTVSVCTASGCVPGTPAD